MISVLFIGIAVMFLFLAMASYVLKLRIEEPHSKVIAVVRREIANENKGAWPSPYGRS